MYADQRVTELFFSNHSSDENSLNFYDSLRCQWNSPSSRKFLITKIISVMIGIGFILCNSLFNLIHPTRSIDCLIDYFHEWTNSINIYLLNNAVARNILIAIASLLIDFNIIMVCMRWIWYGKSLRLFFCILVFYCFRGVIQRIFSQKFPQGYIFLYPNFPSLCVPYAPANDFFFSGHVGICTICFLEFYKDKTKVLSTVAFISIFVEFFALLVTRKHHFVDMVIGFIVAHYIFQFGLWLDESVKNSNYHLFKLMNSEVLRDQRSISIQVESSQNS